MGLTPGAQISLSAALLLLGLGLLVLSPRRPAMTAGVLVLAVASLLLAVAHYVADYFTAEGVNEAVIYHLRYGLAGAGFGEYAGLIVAALAAVALSVAVLWWVTRRRVRGAGALDFLGNPLALLSLCASVALQPASAALLQVLPDLAPASAVAESPRDRALAAEFERHYREPRAAATGARRNLVYVYAEGLERNYFDEGLFPGLLPELRALERESVSFTGIEQVAGASWTIAGMVASQCGIPLFTPADGNAMTGMDAFMPAATCMGDLLKRDGYRLAFYGGAHLRFAGKGKFYATHGFDEVAGRGELVPRLSDPKYFNAWGLYDDALLELAYGRLSELGRAGGRFALFLLTLDTHHPSGHVSRSCASIPYGDGANPILNAVHCTDRLLGEFVRRIRAAPWGRETVIVIASDHLAMRNTAYERLKSKPRRNLFMVLDPVRSAGQRIATPGSLLDVAPTVMSFLGYDAEIGLGANLAAADAAALARARHARDRLDAWREPMTRFWAFPRIERFLEVDAEKRMLSIDGRSFGTPALLELDAGLQTVMRFPRAGVAADELVRELDGRPFVLVAPCTSKDRGLPEFRTCLFAGRDGRFRTQFIVHRSARFPPEAIRRMLGPAT
ncbi:MAG: sulfatase-like hydrolase/transferase [Burkholderiales bacterium]